MPRILLVEDDQMISEIYQRKFEAAGFEIQIAETGKEVLNKVRKEHFDLILLDIVLPEMNGMDVLKELKQSGKYDPLVKVIIFSNLNEKSDQDKAFSLGADGFIFKSQFNPSQLVEEIKRRLYQFDEQQKNDYKRLNGDNLFIPPKENTKKILFVEDEEVFIEMFGERLKNENFEVTVIKNGNQAVKKAMNEDFDLIITDMIVEGMGGNELIAALKQEEKTKNIPIIVLSASLIDEDLRKVNRLGAMVEYYVKTRITPSDLARRAKEILEK